MRIFNEEKTQELLEYDLSKGKLKNDTLTKHIAGQEFVEEQGHYETIKEYPNGGKDVEWVVDVAGQEFIPEHDEEEEIQVYVPYTEKELQNLNNYKLIEELKQHLADTDYKALKYVEGELTEEEYAPIKAQRKAWRDEIGKLGG